jgi:tetratricopeptide (TPR) repeat protein
MTMTTTIESKVEELVALLGLYLRQGKTKKALRILEKSRHEFTLTGADDYWHLWRGQLLVRQGQPGDALGEVDHIKDPEMRRNLKAMALEVSARQSGDWQPLREHLEQSFQETNDGGYLFELCRLKAYSEDWSFVADHADELVKSVGTADAVQLAAAAAWKAERYEQCLNILNDHQRLFPNGLLPADLWRLRVTCHVRQGTHSQAVADAEELIRRDPSTANIITLMDVQISKGDLKGAAITARALRQRDDVPADALVRTAGLIHPEDIELAKDFWRRAKDEALNDPTLLGGAIGVGFALGLDEELGPLFQRMQKMAAEGQGSFKVFDIKQLLSMTKERAEHLEEVNRLYNESRIPLHLVSGVTKNPLASYLHGIPEWNRAKFDPLRQLRVFSRYGGRPVQKELAESSAEWRLHLDISALLLAADAEILDKVEECFKPLRIPGVLPKALLAQYKRLESGQPSRLVDYRNVLELQGRNLFRLIPGDDKSPAQLSEWTEKMGGKWLAVVGRAQAEGGFVVDFLPLRTNDSDFELVTLPREVEDHLVNCRALIESLRKGGRISDHAFQRAVEKLGAEGNDLGRPNPPLGVPLFLTGTIASVLASAEMLEPVCKDFRVFVDPLEIDLARGEVAEAERRGRLMTWLRSLMERLRSGLENETYEFIGISDEQRRQAKEERVKGGHDPDEDDLTLASLMDLFLFTSSRGDVLWIDDRFISSYLHRDGAPIIGINEVLAALLARGEIDEAEYYAKLLRLRSGNVRYIPIQRKEILYHLRQAQCREGVLLETPDLSVLRRYVAACLLDTQCLQRPTAPVGPSGWVGELIFVMNTQRAVTDAMAEVWTDTDATADVAAARADWLLHNMYTGGVGTRELLPDPDSRGDGLDLIGIDIAGAYMKAFNIGEVRREGDELNSRQQYFRWLDSRLTSRRFKADRGAVVAAAKSVGSLISGAAMERYEDPTHDIASRLVLQRVFLDLPETLKNELKLDPEVMARLGVRILNTAVVGSLNFQAENLWPAFEKAVNGERVMVEAHDPEVTYTLTKVTTDETRVVVNIEDSLGAVVGRVNDPLFYLLDKNLKRREEVLRENRAWFDCEEETFEKEVKEIASTEDIRARMERADKWRKESAAIFYRNLASKIASGTPLYRSDLLPPSAAGLLRHFRLDLATDDTNFADLVSRSALLLLREEELEEAIKRLINVPMKMPDVLVERLAELEEDDRRKLVEDLLLRCVSPVSRLNLVDLVLRSTAGAEEIIDLARTNLTELFDDEQGKTSFSLFSAFLTVVNEELGYWDEASSWPAEIKLALVWAHAGKLQNTFYAPGNKPDSLLGWLQAPDRLIGTEILFRDTNYWYDVLHPRKINRTEFLSHGVAAALTNNDLRKLERIGVKELIRQVAFIDSDEAPDVKMPSIHLLKDPTLATNRTGSFLGGDRATVLAPVIGEEGTALLASYNLEELVKETIEDLNRDPKQLHRWLTIYGVIGSNSIYPGLREQYRSLLRDTDLVSLYKADARSASMALRLGSDYLLHYPDEEQRQKYEAALLRLIELEKSKQNLQGDEVEEVPSRDAAASDFLETALTLSIRPGDPRGTSRAFGELLIKMLNTWPHLGEYFASTVSKLVYELPARQLRGLWPVMLHLRASQGETLVER